MGSQLEAEEDVCQAKKLIKKSQRHVPEALSPTIAWGE
jgi:hypothetical protein